MAVKKRFTGSIKMIWAIARELEIEKDDLYILIDRETGKDSMKQLSQKEIDSICMTLSRMQGQPIREPGKKRTDTGGNPDTERLRRKIYMLTGELGWNDNDKRINGFVKKMFGVERLEWLKPWQCHKLIEALKEMVERKEHGGNTYGNDNRN